MTCWVGFYRTRATVADDHRRRNARGAETASVWRVARCGRQSCAVVKMRGPSPRGGPFQFITGARVLQLGDRHGQQTEVGHRA
jgi:hypothetical protein